MASFYATTEQKYIHSFCDALRIRRYRSTNYTKVRAMHRLYTTLHKTTLYVNGVLCKMLLRVAVYCYFFFFCVQHMADAIHTTDQTGKNVYHVTQFHPMTVNHICFRYISCHIDNRKSI